jgi:(R,R)-butanediol dehydrogenase/meso-butanediol dehydrogenase/diacetyl reductase/L-iditol 2-dehydrogenase
LLDLEPLTATWFPFDQAVEAFAEHMSGRHPKVLIRCNDVDGADA